MTEPRDPGSGLPPALLLLVAALILAAGGWWMLAGQRRAEALEPAEAPAPAVAAAPELEGAGAREDVEREAVEAAAPAAAPTAEEEAAPAPAPPPPEAVLLSGAAVRVEPDGSERADLDGRIEVWVWLAGHSERHDVEVAAGRFTLRVPPDATLRVRGLALGGAAVALEQTEYAVPADRFLLLRGLGMRGVLLHVLDARDRSELSAVELRTAGDSVFSDSWRHPGAEPEGEPLLRGVPSPVLVVPASETRRSTRVYWVRAPGFAWAPVTLDHAAAGERTVELVRAGSLTVALVGCEEWLEPEVRLWPPDARPHDAYCYAKRAPDAEQRATFQDVVPGTYVASVERGWAQNRVSFGQATVEVLAGEHASATIGVQLPARPREVRVSGTLTLPAAWERAGTKLVFDAQDEASVWMPDDLELAASSMSPAGAERYAWEVTLPVAGSYELGVKPQWLRQLLTVPPEGLRDLEIVVPPPALVEVRVVDAASGDEVPVERLYWSPPRVEGILGTPLLPGTADPATGRVTFRAPAMPIQISPADYTLDLADDPELFELEPGRNELEIQGRRQVRVRFRFLDGEAEVPWSWDWRVGARRVDGEGRDVARGIGMLYFREPGAYELFADEGIPGYASIDGTPFDVRPRGPGEEEAVVVVRLVRE